MPLVFGLGGPLVAMVGTNIGAGQRDRALRAAWIGAAHRGGPDARPSASPRRRFRDAWLSLFDTDPGDARGRHRRYLRTVGPFYGLFGLGMALYFASQGAGRLLWPLLANLTRLAIAGGGGWLALRWSGELSSVFAVQALALVVFGLVFAEPVRTAIGTFGGSLKDVPAPALGAVAIEAAVARAGIRPEEVETVVMGNVVQAGEKMNPARQGRPCRAAGDDAGADREPRLRLGRAGHRVGGRRRFRSAISVSPWRAAWRTWTRRPISSRAAAGATAWATASFTTACCATD